MQYRALKDNRIAVSAVSLELEEAGLSRVHKGRVSLIDDAVNLGVNAYHFSAYDAERLVKAGDTLATLEREYFFYTIRLGPTVGRLGRKARDFSAEGLEFQLGSAMAALKLDFVNAVFLDDPAPGELSDDVFEVFDRWRRNGRTSSVGVRGAEGVFVNDGLSNGAFDVLAAPFPLGAQTRGRSRISRASANEAAVFAYDWYPDDVRDLKAMLGKIHKRGLFDFRPKDPMAEVGTFSFLHTTPGWSAEALCLAYALCEPAIVSAIITATDTAHLTELAGVVERSLPGAVAPQIELAVSSLKRA